MVDCTFLMNSYIQSHLLRDSVTSVAGLKKRSSFIAKIRLISGNLGFSSSHLSTQS